MEVVLRCVLAGGMVLAAARFAAEGRLVARGLGDWARLRAGIVGNPRTAARTFCQVQGVGPCQLSLRWHADPGWTKVCTDPAAAGVGAGFRPSRAYEIGVRCGLAFGTKRFALPPLIAVVTR